MLQCGEPCNPAIGSFGRWESIRQKALLWKGLDKFGSVHECVYWELGFMHDSCRFSFSNTKKLEQAQKGQKKREEDQCQSQY